MKSEIVAGALPLSEYPGKASYQADEYCRHFRQRRSEFVVHRGKEPNPGDVRNLAASFKWKTATIVLIFGIWSDIPTPVLNILWPYLVSRKRCAMHLHRIEMTECYPQEERQCLIRRLIHCSSNSVDLLKNQRFIDFQCRAPVRLGFVRQRVRPPDSKATYNYLGILSTPIGSCPAVPGFGPCPLPGGCPHSHARGDRPPGGYLRPFQGLCRADQTHVWFLPQLPHFVDSTSLPGLRASIGSPLKEEPMTLRTAIARVVTQMEADGKSPFTIQVYRSELLRFAKSVGSQTQVRHSYPTSSRDTSLKMRRGLHRMASRAVLAR